MSETSIKMVIPKDGKGVLKWLFIDGKGKDDLNGNPKYTAQVVLTPDQAGPYIETIQAYWEENRPANWKVTKADAVKDKKLKVGDPKDPTYLGFKEDEDGNFVFTFKTNPTYQDGTQKVIDIYNAKAVKISLGDKKIGNNSLGALSGIMDIFHNTGNCGVTFYLNAVQLTKFIEFSTDAGFEAQDEEGFEGLDDSMSEFEAVDNSSSESSEGAKPRL